MKIIIKDGDLTRLILTDDEFDFNGWVNLRIEDKEMDIHIEELYPAVVAFLEKYNLNKEDRLR